MDISTADRMPLPSQTSLFQVFLRLRPPQAIKQQSEQWLVVEPSCTSDHEHEHGGMMKPSVSTHITLQPPNDSRKRAIERFGFTKIFQEEASQTDIFRETGTDESIKTLVQDSRDGLVATLGVTGSGKSHTILGTKSQRGLTQMTLDVLYQSLGQSVRHSANTNLVSALQDCDPSESQILSANSFLEMVYGDGDRARMSRAQTPMTGIGSRSQTPMVWQNSRELPGSFPITPPGISHDPSMLRPDVALAPKHSVLSVLGNQLDSKRLDRTLVTRRTICATVTKPCEDSANKEKWRPPSRVPFWTRLNPSRPNTKISFVKESMPNHHTRRPPMPRPSTFAQVPDVSSHTFEIDHRYEYAVLVSMYEVYNDRIFDLLSNAATPTGPAMSTRQGAALQKGLMRRPLLFKNTELSPERKVVAGLRKIVCDSYEEAMMVLETGLHERRVAGTGSNSVSSRSHGFFCIEVKKQLRGQFYSSKDWIGATLSIVDLAGSERARNAKTTGSTLAEAGKINESLMYLGQCLQVQSDCQQDGSKPIVPFRQCKLTELLFSNSFPSAAQLSTSYRQPQRAVMIVTADPQGDFNATSQILRYSALAREVTVPRIPSVTLTIGTTVKTPTGRATPHDNYFAVQELEQATSEARKLAEECQALAIRLAEEEIKRTETELKLQAAEERLVVSEQEIREECWQDMESTLGEEKQRWRTAWEEERLRGEEYLDDKIDILGKTSQFPIHSDMDEKSRIEELERENELLRARLQHMEQELQIKSPTKKTKAASKSPVKSLVLQGSSNTNLATNPFLASLNARQSGSALKLKQSKENMVDPFDVSPRKLSLRSSSIARADDENSDALELTGTAKKKTRKLTTRKWDLGDPSEL